MRNNSILLSDHLRLSKEILMPRRFTGFKAYIGIKKAIDGGY